MAGSEYLTDGQRAERIGCNLCVPQPHYQHHPFGRQHPAQFLREQMGHLISGIHRTADRRHPDSDIPPDRLTELLCGLLAGDLDSSDPNPLLLPFRAGNAVRQPVPEWRGRFDREIGSEKMHTYSPKL